MSDFETQQEVWTALIEGKELECHGERFKFIDGRLSRLCNRGTWRDSSITCCLPELWSYYTPPKRQAPFLEALAWAKDNPGKSIYRDGGEKIAFVDGMLIFHSLSGSISKINPRIILEEDFQYMWTLDE